MHSRDTGPLDNLGPFGPIVINICICYLLAEMNVNQDDNEITSYSLKCRYNFKKDLHDICFCCKDMFIV